MKFTIVISSPPDHPTTKAAIDFCQALLRRQQVINCIFLLGHGAKTASQSELWSALHKQQIPVYCCVNSAQSYQLADEYGRATSLLAPYIELRGLSQLVVLSKTSNKVITFGHRETKV